MNRLSTQLSPYLLQRANDPVEWQPWDSEALALAKSANKPILLSIGYSASHQCQVMARESFQSVQVAALMNEHFVNILVDREERPDLDRIYQTAHGLLNRKPGGWPLTMMLDPSNQLPFFGGTYFPPQPRPQAPGFREVLKGIAKMYSTPNNKMDDFKAKFSAALTQVLGGNAPGAIDVMLVDRACGQIDASFDAKHGGFSEAPKYPHPAGLELLLDAAHFTTEEAKASRATYMLDFTLQAIADGGLFDHLGGGFHRDAVDAEWTTPHFEKMLYDNAQLLSLYARRAQQTGLPRFSEAAHRTADWLLREMQLENGSFCGSLAADSDGGEGRYYLWSKDALHTVLGERYDSLAESLGFSGKALFVDGWQLRLAAPEPDAPVVARSAGNDVETARAQLSAVRADRVRPSRDDKILTAWNALAIRGLADMAQFQGRPDCLLAATQCVDFLRTRHWQDGRLLAYSRDGVSGRPGLLDDYAFLLDALLVLLAAHWRNTDLVFAINVAEAMLEQFEDSEQGGFYFTAADHETLLQRTKAFGDDACPSGNGTAVRALLELGTVLGEQRYLDAAERGLRAGMIDAGRWPSAHATLMRAVLDQTSAAARVVLRSNDVAGVAAWPALVADKLPASTRCYVVPVDSGTFAAIEANYPSSAGAAVTAFICRGNVRSPAATDLATFAQLLAAGAATAA